MKKIPIIQVLIKIPFLFWSSVIEMQFIGVKYTFDAFTEKKYTHICNVLIAAFACFFFKFWSMAHTKFNVKYSPYYTIFYENNGLKIIISRWIMHKNSQDMSYQKI